WNSVIRSSWRIFTSAKVQVARANGTQATAFAAPSVSWKRWNIPFFLGTAACRHSDSQAVRTARSAKIGYAERTARWTAFKAPMPPSWTPARQSSSRRRPPAVTGSRQPPPSSVLCMQIVRLAPRVSLCDLEDAERDEAKAGKRQHPTAVALRL